MLVDTLFVITIITAISILGLFYMIYKVNKEINDIEKNIGSIIRGGFTYYDKGKEKK